MAHFEVGKKVICIKNHSEGEVKAGDVFELLGIKKGCCKIAPILLDVGCPAPYGSYCGDCGDCGDCDDSNICWLNSALFAPYDDSLSEVTAEELIETLETQLV